MQVNVRNVFGDWDDGESEETLTMSRACMPVVSANRILSFMHSAPLIPSLHISIYPALSLSPVRQLELHTTACYEECCKERIICRKLV